MAINTNYYGDYYRRNDFATQNRFNNVSQQNNANIFENQTDVFKSSVSSACKDGKDDGSIGFWEATKNVLKGGVKFFTGMFTDENGDFSLKQTLKTVAFGVGIGLATMIPVVGPLVIPALCTYGMLHGGKQVLSGISNAMDAKTDAEAQAAWQEVGSGATEGVLSYTGYKATGGFKKAWSKTTADYTALKAKHTSTPKPAASETPASAPVTEAPAPKPVEEPVQPVVEKPVKPVVEEPATPVVEEPVKPVVEEPVTPVVEEPVQPVVEESATPVIEEPVKPVVEEPATPVVEEPVQSATNVKVDAKTWAESKEGTTSNGFDISARTYKQGFSNKDTVCIRVKNSETSGNATCYVEKEYVRPTQKSLSEYADANGEYSAVYLECLNGKGGGAGTEVVKQVVQLSKDLGLEGRVTLNATVLERAKGSPVPFYHKLGFKSVNPEIESEILAGMENLKTTGKYTGPRDTWMYLPLDKVEALLNR